MNSFPQIDRLIEVVERYCGKFVARWIVYLAVVAFFAFCVGMTWQFLLGPVYRFVARNMRGTDLSILEKSPQLLTTILVLVLFVLLAFIVLGAIRSLSRYRVPQKAIDGLARFRDEGISVLNDFPKDEADLSRWEGVWKTWMDKVVAYLGENFTEAERLGFYRLGVIDEKPLSQAINDVHRHYLMMLSKQLRILEGMIARYLDRR